MNRSTAITNVIVVVVLVLCAGTLLVATAPVTGADETSQQIAQESDTANETAFGTNVTVGSDAFSAAENDFWTANDELAEAVDSLHNITNEINESGTYDDDTHGSASDELEAIEDALDALSEAESDAAMELTAADLRPAEQFLIIDAVAAERETAKQSADEATESYKNAVVEQRSEPQSTVRLYFSAALVVGLLIGLVLGAIVPAWEARNVRDQMRLSRDVTYNKRAGYLPIAAGILLVVCGVGVLWWIGISNVIRVIV